MNVVSHRSLSAWRILHSAENRHAPNNPIHRKYMCMHVGMNGEPFHKWTVTNYYVENKIWASDAQTPKHIKCCKFTEWFAMKKYCILQFSNQMQYAIIWVTITLMITQFLKRNFLNTYVYTTTATAGWGFCEKTRHQIGKNMLAGVLECGVIIVSSGDFYLSTTHHTKHKWHAPLLIHIKCVLIYVCKRP